MRLDEVLLKTLPVLLGAVMLPMPAFAILERTFLYFPDRTLVATPAVARLEYEDVFFSAEDGVQLHGWYVPGVPGKPVVVFCHGNAGNISHRIENLRLLRELGLAVFIISYRGYGRSDGTPSEQGTYSDMRGALAWLRDRGWSADRMIYFGRSLGAGVALHLALEQAPGALVLESPFSSIPAMGRLHYPVLWRLAGWAIDARYDNLAKIGRLSSPLLVFHGQQDEVVPLDMGKQLFDGAPEPRSFHSIAGAGHNDTYRVGGARYWQRWRELIEVNF